jgi:hypothetical protein
VCKNHSQNYKITKPLVKDALKLNKSRITNCRFRQSPPVQSVKIAAFEISVQIWCHSAFEEILQLETRVLEYFLFLSLFHAAVPRIVLGNIRMRGGIAIWFFGNLTRRIAQTSHRIQRDGLVDGKKCFVQRIHLLQNVVFLRGKKIRILNE